MLAKQVQTMAAYNRWMNDKLYAACADISDEERKADRKAFFKSIHGTLNHILLADRVWFGRFIGRPVMVKSLDQELYTDFAALRAERGSTDQDIEGWAQGLRDDLSFMIERGEPLADRPSGAVAAAMRPAAPRDAGPREIATPQPPAAGPAAAAPAHPNAAGPQRDLRRALANLR